MSSHDTIDDADWQRLYEAAVAAHDNAWAPYSKYPVGAAFLTADGQIFAGCNVENATLGATICAERTAIGNALTAGERDFRALCVVTESAEPAAPCGICRQSIAEFVDGDFPILVSNTAGKRWRTTLDELLPHRFSGAEFQHD